MRLPGHDVWHDVIYSRWFRVQTRCGLAQPLAAWILGHGMAPTCRECKALRLIGNCLQCSAWSTRLNDRRQCMACAERAAE